jgi:hypothetical protein
MPGYSRAALRPRAASAAAAHDAIIGRHASTLWSAAAVLLPSHRPPSLTSYTLFPAHVNWRSHRLARTATSVPTLPPPLPPP